MKNINILSLAFLALVAMFCVEIVFFTGCSSKSDDDKKSLEYANKISIGISLSPSSFLSDIDKDDIIITIVNNGDKTITELSTDVVFMKKIAVMKLGKQDAF